MNGEFMPKGGRKTSRLPVTLASLAVKLFQASCKENNINLHAFLGMKETKRKAYNPNTGRYRTKKALQPDDSMSILEQWQFVAITVGVMKPLFVGIRQG